MRRGRQRDTVDDLAYRSAIDAVDKPKHRNMNPDRLSESYVRRNLKRADVHEPFNNFYIKPFETDMWIDTELADERNKVSTTRLHDEVAVLTTPFTVRDFTNEERQSDPLGFSRNEMNRMLSMPASTANFYPTLEQNVGDPNQPLQLSIPTHDVRDLPVYLMNYVLYALSSQAEHEDDSQMVMFSTDNDATLRPIYSGGRPITIDRGRISVSNVRRIYSQLIREFAGNLPGVETADDEKTLTWSGSEESGTRIRLLNMGNDAAISIHIVFQPVHHQIPGHCWTQEIEDVIMQNISGAVVSVRNRRDNKCLLYCIIMGIIIKLKAGGSRAFGLGNVMIEDYEVYTKGALYFHDDMDPITRLIKKLSSYLMPAVGEEDEIRRMVNNLDIISEEMISITGFRQYFEQIERTLIPNKECGIDVYGIDFGINKHVYPLYISKNRERVIELLCITPKDLKCSHYCVIINFDALMKKTAGKQFFSCSKCGECFYHRRLLHDHKCPITNGDAIQGCHYSCAHYDESIDIPIGYCSKCRLWFIDHFRYDYHKEHCLMEGIVGYRHVQLVQYNKPTQPFLEGEALDREAEEGHVKRRRMMYADFESSINPHTGDHTFMSFGIYEWQSETYKVGYDLGDFFDFIMEKALSGEEDHIYVYFHNAMGYDANFILRYVLSRNEYKNWGIQVIMKSTNRLQKLVFYIHDGEQTRTIHICDTFLFLTLSLERIVGSIRKDDLRTNQENFSRFFTVFRNLYPSVSDEEIDHILRKNIFPYKFFDTADRLDTPIDEFREIFTPREENLKYFSERVTLEDLDDGYSDTTHVMEVFNCQTARDYHDLYLCCDVMQLADVFDRSMRILWESHHIHLTRYLGMPSASWAAFLRHDPLMKIPLYEDTFYAEFFKNMIRGGITSAALRHAVADEEHSIIYADVNGLYPYVMQAYPFPCGKFGFLMLNYDGARAVEWLKEQFIRFRREGVGMCFCVDLHIPDHVKELTDMYPFAPEHRRIYSEYFTDEATKTMTPFLKKWSEANDGETMKEFTGLVCTLYDKKNYNVHWRLLEFYMKHGVEVQKLHFAVTFSEGDYLAGYIRKNIEIRNTRKDELGKTLYKLLGNSIYGKTFESPFKRNTFEIIRDPVKLQGLMEEGNIAAIVPITADPTPPAAAAAAPSSTQPLGWIVRMDGEDIVLDKPTYIGACVCEFSKLHMYTLLYDQFMKIFPKCELVYTDTDSFILKVQHPPGIRGDPKELFDYIRTKDPTLFGSIGGQIKSETGEDDTIEEAVALRSKVYAYKTKHGHIGKRAKGTTHDAQEMQLDWDTYKQALETLVSVETRNNQFVRKVFKIASVDVFRQSLSVNDGKRDIMPDGVHTHAFGYFVRDDPSSIGDKDNIPQ